MSTSDERTDKHVEPTATRGHHFSDLLSKLLPAAVFATIGGAVWVVLRAAGSPLAGQSAFITALVGSALILTVAATILRRRYVNWREEVWRRSFQDEVRRPTGIDRIYNNLDDARSDIVNDIRKASSIRLFVQLGRYMLGGPHALLYDVLASTGGSHVSVRLLHAGKDSPFLSRDRLRKRGSSGQAIQAGVDHLRQQMLALRDEAGVQVEMRQHREPYLWRLLFFDDVTYVSGYLHDRDNDKLAFVYRIIDGSRSLYKIFDKYFEYLWEIYPPLSGDLDELIPRTAASSAAVLLRKDRKNIFMVFDRAHDVGEKRIYRFAAIGGKRTDGETWLDCALREGAEETGANLRILHASNAVYLDLSLRLTPLSLAGAPGPLGVVETPDEATGLRSGWGKRYTVVYAAAFDGPLRNRSEIRGFLTISDELLVRIYRRETTFEEYLKLGGEFSGDRLSKDAVLQPYGAAELLALCLESGHQVLSSVFATLDAD